MGLPTVLAGTIGSLLLCAGPVRGYNPWTPLGLSSEQVRSIAVAPSASGGNTLVVGTGNPARVFIGDNGGMSWSMEKPFDDLGSEWKDLDALELSPNFQLTGSSGTIIAGGANIQGVVRSDDAGGTWASVVFGLPASGLVWDIALSRTFADDRMVVTAGNSGVYKSTDGGLSFTAANDGLPTHASAMSVAISPAFTLDQTLLAGLYGIGGGVYRSVNSGASWQNTSGLPVGCYVEAIELSPAFANDGIAFCTVSAPSSSLYRSTDRGQSWTGVWPHASLSDNSLAVSPEFELDRTVAMVCGADLWLSSDAGLTWDAIAFPQPGGVLWQVAFSPQFSSDRIIYVGGPSAGVWSVTVPEPSAALSLLGLFALRTKTREAVRI